MPQPHSDDDHRDWDERYRQGQAPWDTGRPSPELVRVLAEERVTPGRALELGCGTGTNALYLAGQGFSVTAVDGSSVAIERARQRAARQGLAAEFVQGDVCALPAPPLPYDLLFDRGCYHCVRGENLTGYVGMLQRVTAPGSKFLLLAGNAREPRDPGPPTVSEEELRAELGGLFDFVWIREFRFEDPDGTSGPLAWSCWLVRK
jgi:methyl halide transferase